MLDHLDKLSKSRVLVIGDVMLDRYLWGEVSRISPEAPVPVVRVRGNTQGLGGAGNTASNLAGLECPVALIGLRGADEAGELLMALLEKRGIENRLLVSPSHPTITKTRVVAHGQQVVRLDEEEHEGLNSTVSKRILSLAEETLPSSQAMILSDYGKGLLQMPGLAQALIALGKKHDIPVLVDPKGRDWERYHGATCITPNTAELELVTQSDLGIDGTTLVARGQSIRQEYNLAWLLVTCGPQGICLIGTKGPPLFIQALTREVYDVSGAGDTVIATLAAGVASGLPFPEAAQIANLAAGIVVSKLGTQSIGLAELRTALLLNETGGKWIGSVKVKTLDDAQQLVQAWRANGEKIVFTNGCFDLLHPGHIHLLYQARSLGDRLVVGLNSDDSIRRLKGTNRPILSGQDRATLLGALTYVDLVVMFDEDAPLALLEALKPDILVKGADYRVEEVIGRHIVEAHGGHVHLIPILKGYSTTGIANRLSIGGQEDRRMSRARSTLLTSHGLFDI